MGNESSRKVIEKIKKNGKVISFKEVDKKEGMDGILCSLFIKEENVIVRGEGYYQYSSKNFLITAIDAVTKELRGNKCFEVILNSYAFPFKLLIS